MYALVIPQFSKALENRWANQYGHNTGPSSRTLSQDTVQIHLQYLLNFNSDISIPSIVNQGPSSYLQ